MLHPSPDSSYIDRTLGHADPELLPGSGSGIIVPDLDQQKEKEHIPVDKTMNSGLFVL